MVPAAPFIEYRAIHDRHRISMKFQALHVQFLLNLLAISIGFWYKTQLFLDGVAAYTGRMT